MGNASIQVQGAWKTCQKCHVVRNRFTSKWLKNSQNTTGCFKNAKSPKCHDAKRPPHVNRIGYSTFVHAPTKCPFHVVRFHTPAKARHHRRWQNHLDVTSKALRQWSLWTWMNFITMRGMIFKHMSRKKTDKQQPCTQFVFTVSQCCILGHPHEWNKDQLDDCEKR